ncbi:MAG: hypothetical protein IPL83_07000 [Bdellovibrionales bacterium]|nr:hypothetical protein [Bdellovibrionales bacterium]
MSIAIAAMAFGCTKKSNSGSTVRIQFPAAKSNAEKINASMISATGARKAGQGVSSQNSETWALSDPQSLADINCYMVTVGGPDPGLMRHNCTTSGPSIQFGPSIAFVPAGGTAELIVPSGAARVITVLGLRSINAECKKVPEGVPPDYDNLSRPVRLASKVIDLKPGDVSLDLTANMSADFVTSCTRFGASSPIGGPLTVTPISPSGTSDFVTVDKSLSLSANASGGSGTFAYSWTLNNSANAALTASGATATFNSNSSFLGSNMLKVSVTDGTTTVSHSWNITVNGFSSACNKLKGGEVCTVVGQPDVGNGAILPLEASRLRIEPWALAEDSGYGYFVSDTGNRLIWFYNTSSSAVTKLGTAIAPGQMKVLVGTGGVSNATSGTAANMPINIVNSMAWDSTTQTLYYTTTTQNAVFSVTSAGTVSIVLGPSGGHTDGTSGTTQACNGPYGLAIYGNNLYVGCSTIYRIKRVDLSNGLAYTVVGTGAAGNTNGPAGSATIQKPMDIAFDNSGNMYWVEYNTGVCALRVLNTTGGSISFFGGASTVFSSNVGTIAGMAGGCTSGNPSEMTALANQFPMPAFLTIDDPSIVRGFFISYSTGARITYLNNSPSPLVWGGQSISGYMGGPIWGTGTLGVPSFGGPALASELYYPKDMILEGNRLLVADNQNGYIEELNFTSNLINGVVGTGLGRGGKINSTAHAAASSLLSFPKQLSYDALTNSLLIGDMPSSTEVRRLDLGTGYLETYIGGGGSADSIDDLDPLSNLIAANKLQDFTVSASTLVYATATSSTCRIRAYNRTGGLASLFNVNVNPFKISRVAGTSTCGTYVNYNPAISEIVDPKTIEFESGGGLLVGLNAAYCIAKIDPFGVIADFAGTCGTTGDIDSPLLSARFGVPTKIIADPLVAGGYYLLDSANRKIKYINDTGSSVNVMGVTVPANYLKSLYQDAALSSNTLYGLTANAEQICYSSFSTSSNLSFVKCRDRLSGSASLVMGSSGGGLARTTLDLSQEGVVATSASISYPTSLAFDSEGNLFISDSDNNSVRKVKRWY